MDSVRIVLEVFMCKNGHHTALCDLVVNAFAAKADQTKVFGPGNVLEATAKYVGPDPLEKRKSAKVCLAVVNKDHGRGEKRHHRKIAEKEFPGGCAKSDIMGGLEDLMGKVNLELRGIDRQIERRREATPAGIR